MLPGRLWGRGEDYLWYSTGDAANFTDLEAGVLGEATLQARYIRGAFDDKPFTLGKYESTRIRAAIAEVARVLELQGARLWLTGVPLRDRAVFAARDGSLITACSFCWACCSSPAS